MPLRWQHCIDHADKYWKADRLIRLSSQCSFAADRQSVSETTLQWENIYNIFMCRKKATLIKLGSVACTKLCCHLILLLVMLWITQVIQSFWSSSRNVRQCLTLPKTTELVLLLQVEVCCMHARAHARTHSVYQINSILRNILN